MHKYRKLIPVVALILLALGVNLDRFGIDLETLSGQGEAQGHTQTQTQTTQRNSSNTQGDSRSGKGFLKTPSKQRPATTAKLPHWSDTDPEINLWHVFEGEINRKGKPTGFHARPGGQDPANARVVSIKDKPNKAGVYTANIEVRDGRQWKSKFSSFFPDSLSQQQVIDIIVHAYSNSKDPRRQPWSGPSGMGFQVQGYTSSRGGINTAFPVYNRRQ